MKRLAVAAAAVGSLEGNLVDYKLYEFCYKFFSAKVEGNLNIIFLEMQLKSFQRPRQLSVEET